MNGIVRKSVLLIALIFGCANIAYGAEAFPCNGCNISDMRNLASTLGLGSHYIFNLESKRLTLWHVSVEKFGGRRIFATRQARVSPSAKKIWSTLLRLSDQAGTYYPHVTLSYKDLNDILAGELAGNAIRTNSATPLTSHHVDHNFNGFSAWDVVDTRGSLHRQFIILFTNDFEGNGWKGKIRHALVPLINYTMELTQIQFHHAFAFIVTVHFKDGSQIDLGYNSELQKFQNIPGTAYDAEGNEIPEKMYDVSGGKTGQETYTYFNATRGRKDYLEFKQRIARWGIKIVHGDDPWRDSEPRYVNCSGYLANGVSCTIQR